MITIGSPVPHFGLRDQKNNKFKLIEQLGSRVLLSFHPLAWTAVCAQQMQELDKNYEAFISKKVIPVGISVDSIPSKKEWAAVLGIQKLSLLSDFWPHGKLAQELGIFREKNGFSERANLLIDAQGKVSFIKIYDLKELPNISEIMSIIEEQT